MNEQIQGKIKPKQTKHKQTNTKHTKQPASKILNDVDKLSQLVKKKEKHH